SQTKYLVYTAVHTTVVIASVVAGDGEVTQALLEKAVINPSFRRTHGWTASCKGNFPACVEAILYHCSRMDTRCLEYGSQRVVITPLTEIELGQLKPGRGVRRVLRL